MSWDEGVCSAGKDTSAHEFLRKCVVVDFLEIYDCNEYYVLVLIFSEHL